MRLSSFCCLGLLWVLHAGLAAAADGAHQHGAVQLEVVIEPRRLSLSLDAPQEALLGHERAPRGAAELAAAQALITRLKDGVALWRLPPGLACQQRSAEVDAPLLQGTAPAGKAASEHADVEARWQFDCARVDGLRQLDLGPLLDAFPRLQQVSAQIASPSGQYQARAKRPQRLLPWGR